MTSVFDHYGLRKEAVLGSLAHTLGLAVLGHGGTNALGLAAHKGSNIAEVLAHKGMQSGLLEQNLHPVRKQVMKWMIGPEALIPYETANNAAQALVKRFPNPQERNAVLRTILDQYTRAGLTTTSPGMGALAAARHELEGTAPTFAHSGPASALYGKLVNSLSNHVQTGMETPIQKAVGALTAGAPAVPMLAADAAASHGLPLGALSHFGWNSIRQGVGATPIGEKWVGSEIAKGLQGQSLSKGRELAMSMIASPAAVDPRAIGLTLRALPKAEKGMKALQTLAGSAVTHGALYGGAHTTQGKALLEAARKNPLGRVAIEAGKAFGG